MSTRRARRSSHSQGNGTSGGGAAVSSSASSSLAAGKTAATATPTQLKQSGDGSRKLEEAFVGSDASFDNAVRFVRTVARNPTIAFDGTTKLKNVVTRARRSVCTAPQVVGQKRKRKSASGRLCSPALFFESSTDSLRPTSKARPTNPGRAHNAVPMDTYLAFVAQQYYGGSEGGEALDGFQVFRKSMLGQLVSPLRRPQVIDKWAPLEIARFEAALCMYGKEFHLVQRAVKTKTVREVIEFYYVWKMGASYKRWKESFRKQPL